MIWVALSIGIFLGLWGIFWSMWDRRAFAPVILMMVGLVSSIVAELLS